MKAKIYYQDFELNALNFDGVMKVDREKAVEIYEVEEAPNAFGREGYCDAIFHKMNMLDIPVGHPDRPIFERAGHTSMSVGDYIHFEDGQMWVCAKVGWEVQYGTYN
jgi:hypothetical protein